MFTAEGDLLRVLWLDKAAVADGEYWRLWTVTLVHADPLHLLFNMYALYLAGPDRRALVRLDPRSSSSTWPAPRPARSASFVFGGDVPSVGASGAIFGLFGVLLAAAGCTTRSTGQPRAGQPARRPDPHQHRVRVRVRRGRASTTPRTSAVSPPACGWARSCRRPASRRCPSLWRRRGGVADAAATGRPVEPVGWRRRGPFQAAAVGVVAVAVVVAGRHRDCGARGRVRGRRAARGRGRRPSPRAPRRGGRGRRRRHRRRPVSADLAAVVRDAPRADCLGRRSRRRRRAGGHPGCGRRRPGRCRARPHHRRRLAPGSPAIRSRPGGRLGRARTGRSRRPSRARSARGLADGADLEAPGDDPRPRRRRLPVRGDP